MTDRTVSALMVSQAAGISYRKFSYYKQEGLIPLADRSGSRGGEHPEWVIDLTKWIVRLRAEDVPLEVVRDFLPLWRYVYLGEGAAVVPERRAFWLPSIAETLDPGDDYAAIIPATALPNRFPGVYYRSQEARAAVISSRE